MQALSCLTPVGGVKRSHPELTDHCRPQHGATFPEHDYPASGEARCRRCNTTEK